MMTHVHIGDKERLSQKQEEMKARQTKEQKKLRALRHLRKLEADVENYKKKKGLE